MIHSEGDGDGERGGCQPGQAGLVVCLRVRHPTKSGRRAQEVREYATMTPALLGLADWLHDQRIELVAMEAQAGCRGSAALPRRPE
jgi:hypothetical protein